MPFEPKLNVLMAYPYMKADSIAFLAERQGRMRVLIDSGAFTAHSTGKPIRLDCYCAFINDLPFEPWHYFQLDVIGNPEATAANYYAMLEKGFKPIPVYTRVADPAYIEEFYKTTDYVAVGGLVNASHNSRNRAIAQAMKAANGRKVHLLGCTDIRLLKAFRPYSADASSWSYGFRFADLQCYLGYGKFRLFAKENVPKNGLPKWFVAFCAKMGVSATSFLRESAWSNTSGSANLVGIIGSRSWVKYALDVEKYLGVKLFLAVNDVQALQTVCDAFDFISAKYFGGGHG